MILESVQAKKAIPIEYPIAELCVVLRPLSANTDLSDLFEVPELLSPGGMVKKDQLASPRSDSQSQHPAPPLK